MRATFIFSILIFFQLSGCAPFEVAREVTQATQSLETSVKKIFKSQEDEEVEGKITVEKQQISEEQKEVATEVERKITVEKQQISEEQKEATTVVSKQKKIANINLLGKTIIELDQLMGQPQLIREDGKTTIARFDSKICRLFIFINSTSQTPQHVEYYEIRNIKGELISEKKEIESCFKNIGLI